MKRTKQTIAVCALVLACAMALTGCKSTLAEAIALEKARSIVNELDLDAIFSEEEGFHYPGVAWNANVEAVQAATNSAITKLYGYGTNGSTIYTAEYLRSKLLGRKNDDATVSFTESDGCYMFAFVFSNDEVTSDVLSQSDLFEQYYAKLCEKFGEPDDKIETTPDEESDTVTDTTTYLWEYETPDGTVTQLQWGEAFLDYTEEPDYITLGLVWRVANTEGEENETE